MKLYFDESGDTGDIKKKSNTKYFTVAIYLETDSFESEKFIDFFKNKIQSDGRTLKWFKLNKSNKIEFESIYKKLENCIHLISCKKENSVIFGEDMFLQMMLTCIEKNNLYGKYNYDGTHLKKVLNKIKTKIKSKNKKVSFLNKETSECLGIQISDLYAGMVNESLTKNKNNLFKNHTIL